ncbi:glycoside hydrolase family 3 C-terminal domain-containing protein [Asticcacaulis sp. 201]|uniref:glycoside hydrolase family 3 C-terminal domain-containing protein n=1 Tax=Asticcacaulis sp. 201 TaxID=3028787 RepID=UPI002916A413|nr:glycoside hydrolase family 3 C-terminal domain-containing protein [Asticcacaulis sp. 201]MDV6331053.1 glycoside hydrolase family 3 C-terminal domain-containing protein [Asticcacaulis sp. 201]
MRHSIRSGLLATALLAFASSAALAQVQPWMDTSKSPEVRAAAAVSAMTLDEKLGLVMGYTDPDQLVKEPDEIVSTQIKADVAAHHIKGSAGYIADVPRLGIPAQWQTDASIGVRVAGMERTALPSSLATAASFDPKVTEMGGIMIANEARASGFNVFLAGGGNLAREPRNGRNFEYTGEDPVLTGEMTGGLIRGIQSRHMVSTMKHWAVNDQESQRTTVDARISKPAMRQSDLLAFELIYDLSSPGSAMCAYNLVNGDWACENDYLNNQVLKQDWGFKGYVMSDWGAVHSSAKAANNGLDQFTGYPCCGHHGAFFSAKTLKADIASGAIAMSRIDDMAQRILWPLFAKGVVDDPAKVGPIDFNASAAVAQTAAEQSLVLLKNENDLLPLAASAKTIAMIGGNADKGVIQGGGSSGVTPIGGNAVAGLEPKTWPGPVVYIPSSPVAAMKAVKPDATVTYISGDNIKQAAALAKKSDVAIVFVTQWMGEGIDNPLELPGNQDALVAAVVKANPKTIVVVESGGAVLMPWANQVPAILEAFYPGSRGGVAIANILTGKVNPSGHLPISFPASNAQLAHDEIPGFHKPDGIKVSITYDEGAAIGYKWYDIKGFKPLFAFGHGLSYTQFNLTNLKAELAGSDVKVHFSVKNTGKVSGATAAQVYVSAEPAAGWEAPKRLGGFAKVKLEPGASQTVEVKIDPRLLATYDEATNSWVIKAGTYHLSLGEASDHLSTATDIQLPETRFSAVHAR